MGNRSCSSIESIYIHLTAKMQLFFVKITTFGIGATIGPACCRKRKRKRTPEGVRWFG
jgi:hypothetical protein